MPGNFSWPLQRGGDLPDPRAAADFADRISPTDEASLVSFNKLRDMLRRTATIHHRAERARVAEEYSHARPLV